MTGDVSLPLNTELECQVGLEAFLFSFSVNWLKADQAQSRGPQQQGSGKRKAGGRILHPSGNPQIIVRAPGSSSDTGREGLCHGNCSISQLLMGNWRP